MESTIVRDDIVQETSAILPDGRRVLRHEVVIDASPEQVWETFSTSEGLRTFAAPVAEIDLRIGGKWEASYDPAARIGDPGNIVNEVLCFLPIEMLAIRIARTPPGFPNPEVAQALWTIFQFIPEGSRRVRVVTSMLGWQEGPASDRLYDFFRDGNAFVARKLYDHFALATA